MQYDMQSHQSKLNNLPFITVPSCVPPLRPTCEPPLFITLLLQNPVEMAADVALAGLKLGATGLRAGAMLPGKLHDGIKALLTFPRSPQG